MASKKGANNEKKWISQHSYYALSDDIHWFFLQAVALVFKQLKNNKYKEIYLKQEYTLKN